VPGISSALAGPASLNIPVTARGISESFWVVTGTTKTGEISRDIALAAQSSATVVILMGLNKIQDLMEQFLLVGKDETPVAVIQNGTLPNQKNIIGKVSTIVELASHAHMGSPAIIIVGEVVNYARTLSEVVKEVVVQYQ
jgi:uroporphyrin-III C-methyltransferase